LHIKAVDAAPITIAASICLLNETNTVSNSSFLML